MGRAASSTAVLTAAAMMAYLFLPWDNFQKPAFRGIAAHFVVCVLCVIAVVNAEEHVLIRFGKKAEHP